MITKIIKLDLSNIKDFIKSETIKEKMENKGWAFVETKQTGADTFESKYVKEERKSIDASNGLWNF